MNVDFGCTAEQSTLYERLRAFGTRVLGGEWPNEDAPDGFSREAWKRCAGEGVLGLPIPRAHGGLGFDALTCAFGLEGLGYGCRDNGLLISLGAHMWAVELPIWRFGSDRQKEQYLPGLCSGDIIGAHAITEPDAGSDALSLSTTARLNGDHYVLNGHKVFVTNAPIADVLVVYANVNPRLGFTGVTAFLVPCGLPGVRVETRFQKMGLRTSPWGEITLEDCRVDIGQRLGAEKQGSAIFRTTMAWERALILAPLVGTMQRQIDECISYASERRQFGKSIASFDAVAHRIVDMKLRLEATRLLIQRAAWQLPQDDSSAFSEMAKLHTSEAAVNTFLDAVQVYGGYGYTVDAGVERNLRDSLGTRISSGTSDMQRSVIASKLGLRSVAQGASR